MKPSTVDDAFPPNVMEPFKVADEVVINIGKEVATMGRVGPLSTANVVVETVLESVDSLLSLSIVVTKYEYGVDDERPVSVNDWVSELKEERKLPFRYRLYPARPRSATPVSHEREIEVDVTAVTCGLAGAYTLCTTGGQSPVTNVPSSLDPVPDGSVAKALKWYTVPQDKPVKLAINVPTPYVPVVEVLEPYPDVMP